MRTAIHSLAVALAAMLGVVALADTSSPPANLLANGDFVHVTGADGVPDGWSFSGDPKFVKAGLSQDAGPEGEKSVRMECTSFEAGSGWSHAMLCQVDRVAVRRNYRYTVSFMARASGLRGQPVSVVLQNTSPWEPLGLYQWFTPGGEWAPYVFNFTASRTCREKTRFQVSFNSTGTLWVARASILEKPPRFGEGPRRPARPIPAAGRNLVPNAGFECGPAGWGSESAVYITWAAHMDRLFGRVVEDGEWEGRRCLEIALSPQTRPVVNFDYLGPVRAAVKAPLAGNIGWLRIEPGQPYVLSAFLRADADGTPARIGVRQFDGWLESRKLAVGREWQRYAFGFRAKTNSCYVLVGPDLTDSDRASCALRVDAVQLEKGGAPADFAPRTPVEATVRADSGDGIYLDGGKPALIVSAFNAGPAGAAADIELTATDFFDRPAGRLSLRLVLPPGGGEERRIDTGLTRRGFYKIRAAVNGQPLPESVRIALVPGYGRKDSLFGMNHAYGWEELVRAGLNAGLAWARDWSMTWQAVEPVKGRFDFSGADAQVDRALGAGMQVLGLLPFPSSDWSSSAPDSVAVSDKYPANRTRFAYAPRDAAEFRDYVSNTVAHCRGRVKWWQVFNEPLYTDYSLPRAKGYTPEDYVRLVRAFREAARSADGGCMILAGPGGWASGAGGDLEGMLRAGLLENCDALDLHVYPEHQPPEMLEPDLVRVGLMMERYGGRKPIWLTEHGFYADDDLQIVPPDAGRFPPVMDSEREQAEYSMRFNLLLLANGVRRIFYHAGTSEQLNRDMVQGVFFRYGGQPRKIYAALAAMADLLPPGARLLKDVSPAGRRWRALIFGDGGRLVMAAWQPEGAGGQARLEASGRKVELRDIVGCPVEGRKIALSPSVVYAAAEGMSAADFERSVAVEEAAVGP